MDLFTLDSWRKNEETLSSSPIGKVQFRVKEHLHIQLEMLQTTLENNREENGEQWLDVNMKDIELEMPKDCGRLKTCQFRVFLRESDQRGLFHLVGRSAMNDDLIYSNAVLICSLG